MAKVLIACEYSGVVRDAFTKAGHDATSCDILPTESEGKHYQGDILDILNDGWDLMIAHPPCQYLTNAGIRWFNEERYGDKARERKKLRAEAFDFFMKLVNAPIPKIAVENPVGWVNSHYRKANQIIHPYYFGDPENKRTCLWLKNLPNLQPTNIVEPKVYAYYKSGAKKGKPIYWCDYQGRRKDAERWKIRSTTFQGIADAMANQWGYLL
jgi:site-specific DNA-cytosine methylase